MADKKVKFICPACNYVHINIEGDLSQNVGKPGFVSYDKKIIACPYYMNFNQCDRQTISDIAKSYGAIVNKLVVLHPICETCSHPHPPGAETQCKSFMKKSGDNIPQQPKKFAEPSCTICGKHPANTPCHRSEPSCTICGKHPASLPCHRSEPSCTICGKHPASKPCRKAIPSAPAPTPAQAPAQAPTPSQAPAPAPAPFKKVVPVKTAKTDCPLCGTAACWSISLMTGTLEHCTTLQLAKMELVGARAIWN